MFYKNFGKRKGKLTIAAPSVPFFISKAVIIKRKICLV